MRGDMMIDPDGMSMMGKGGFYDASWQYYDGHTMTLKVMKSRYKIEEINYTHVPFIFFQTTKDPELCLYPYIFCIEIRL
jgi:hypothetical protein